MDGTHVRIMLLLICHIVAMASVWAAGNSPSVTEAIQTAATSNGSQNTTISTSIVTSTISEKEAVNTTTVQSISASWNTTAVTAKITSPFTSTLSHFARSTLHPPNTDTSSPSNITTRFKTVVTSPIISPFNQATDKDSNPKKSAITLIPISQHSAATQLNTTKGPDSVPITQASGGTHLRTSEAVLTISFSSILTFGVLVIVICSLDKYRKKRAQYSHHPLSDTSSETVDIYTAPDDTLVISGGLYDAPRAYNPSLIVLEDDEVQAEYLPSGSRPGQFRLEVLPSEMENGLSPTFDTFQSPSQVSM